MQGDSFHSCAGTVTSLSPPARLPLQQGEFDWVSSLSSGDGCRKSMYHVSNPKILDIHYLMDFAWQLLARLRTGDSLVIYCSPCLSDRQEVEFPKRGEQAVGGSEVKEDDTVDTVGSRPAVGRFQLPTPMSGFCWFFCSFLFYVPNLPGGSQYS